MQGPRNYEIPSKAKSHTVLGIFVVIFTKFILKPTEFRIELPLKETEMGWTRNIQVVPKIWGCCWMSRMNGRSSGVCSIIFIMYIYSTYVLFMYQIFILKRNNQFLPCVVTTISYILHCKHSFSLLHILRVCHLILGKKIKLYALKFLKILN